MLRLLAGKCASWVAPLAFRLHFLGMDWDLTSYFPAFEHSQRLEFTRKLREDLMVAVESAARLPAVCGETLEEWAERIVGYEDLRGRMGHLASYLSCLCSADSGHEGYSAARAELSAMYAPLQKVLSSLMNGLAAASEADFGALLKVDSLEGAADTLREMRYHGAERMPLAEEALAADLGVDGISAWAGLYSELQGQLSFTLKRPGGDEETVPMSQSRSLMTQPDRALRKAAYEGSNTTWREHRTTVSTALNSLAGTRLTLQGRRRQRDFLKVAAEGSRTTVATLDALFGALESERSRAREVLAARSRLMGLEKAAFYDWGAPLPQTTDVELDWGKGCALVEQSFQSKYPAMADYFRTMLRERHFDYTPRANKRPGGFCTSSPITREPRIFMTFQNTLNEVVTLAHEVGHAWHTMVLRSRRPFAASYPMTLAETASTFAEKILVNGILRDPSSSEQAKRALLDSESQGVVAYLLDIPMRFLFEKAFYEERSQGVVAASRLESLMVETQQRVFGDTLAEDGANPLFWASKQHFFFDGVFFYNFPYVFGYLLSAGLMARFEAEGPSFLPAYEAFLSDTGSMSCEEVVQKHLGEDLEKPDFWVSGIRQVCSSVAGLAELS